MRLRNFTQHPVILQQGDKTVTLPSEGFAKVDNSPGTLALFTECNGIMIPIHNRDQKGEVTGLPEPQEGVFLIVSAMVGEASDREDLLVPGTGPKDETVRNEKGHVVAITRLKFPF